MLLISGLSIVTSFIDEMTVWCDRRRELWFIHAFSNSSLQSVTSLILEFSFYSHILPVSLCWSFQSFLLQQLFKKAEFVPNSRHRARSLTSVLEWSGSGTPKKWKNQTLDCKGSINCSSNVFSERRWPNTIITLCSLSYFWVEEKHVWMVA